MRNMVINLRFNRDLLGFEPVLAILDITDILDILPFPDILPLPDILLFPGSESNTGGERRC